MARVKSSFDKEVFIYGDTYYYRGTPPGFKRRFEQSLKIKVGARQKDVLQEKQELIERISRLGVSVGAKSSFKNLILKYLEFRNEEAVSDKNPISKKTLQETTIIINKHFLPFFAKYKISEIDQAVFTSYCSVKMRYKINLVNHRKVMNHFLKWCVGYSYLRYRSEIQIPRFALRSRRKREILTNDEITSLLTNAEGKALLYISFYLLMGMRNSEICKLMWSEVSFEKASLQVNMNNNRTKKFRVVPINSFVLGLLKKERETNLTEYVFPAKTKTSNSKHIAVEGGIRKPWKKALKDAGIKRDITPHDLRATFEKFMHTNKSFTDTQREKMAGANIDVQKNIYITMDAEDLRGLEQSVHISGLSDILMDKLNKYSSNSSGGNGGGKSPKTRRLKSATA